MFVITFYCVFLGDIFIFTFVSPQYFAHAHALKCLFVNAQGLVSKFDVLKQYVSEMKIDIIGIAIETFLNGDVMLAEISILGYTAYRKDR